ncbi:hypothetical protein [Pseudomonas sp. 25571]|uniref:hypothetical protein n=1 Tax=Pseudomonas sp. 25571 TaxID=2967216 RepID=UPI002364A3EF|nr:hypothetical protein [Pseudomonas sp. 25571]MDD2064516.1 hypothetical protein [Pseudomonas sp. 25571]
MTCILVAHLGDEVIIAADKRVSEITQDGVRVPCGDDEEKIVRTALGVITGTGSVAMLDYVKSLVRDHGFSDPFEVLELILRTRDLYSEEHAASPHLEADLAETSWMFTYPIMLNDQPVTRFVFYHPMYHTQSLIPLEAGNAICFPGDLSSEQAQALQADFQSVVTHSLESCPAGQARQFVMSYMLMMMSEISAARETVSSTCDIALVDGSQVQVAMSVSADDEELTFAPMAHRPGC